MKKRWVFPVLAIALAAALALAGCSASKSAELRQTYAPEAASKPADNAYEAGGEGALPAIDMGDAAASGKKIIYTAEMSVEAEDAAAAIQGIASKAVALGGYVSGSQYYETSRRSESWITVRIAPEKLNELTAYVGSLGRVKNQSVSSQDVTAQYTDLESWLKNAQAQEAQLLEYMKRAVEVEDLLRVRQELNTVQREIEQYKGQLRLMDNQVAFSTVTVRINEPPAPSVTVEEEPGQGVRFWGFAAVWQKISRGFSDGFNWTLNALSWVLMVLSYIIVPLVLVAAAIAVVLAVLRVVRKRKK